MSNPFAFLLGEQPAAPAAWPDWQTRRHILPDDMTLEGVPRKPRNVPPRPTPEAARANMAKARAVRSAKAAERRAAKVREPIAGAAAELARKFLETEAAPAPAPAPAPAVARAADAVPPRAPKVRLWPEPKGEPAPPAPMTYSQAVAIRERSRTRQPVDSALLLEANRLVSETRAARRLEAYGT